MKNLVKTGVTASAIAILSLVGFTAAFGYGGGGGSSGGSGWEDPRCRMPVQPRPGHDLHVKGHDGQNVYDRNVKLDLDGGDAEYMMVSENPDFTGATIEPYSDTRNFQLSDGEGSKMVYVRFFNHCKVPSNVYSEHFNFRKHRPGRVLGAQTYADGTLLRGSDNRVYVVKGNTLVYIPDLTVLRKYVGHEILKVDDSVIADFADINAPQQEVLGVQVYANGSLLRGSDHVMVYVLKNGHKVHVLNLEELAAHYFGKPIFDVSDDVLSQY
jgi:hypothetical protein